MFRYVLEVTFVERKFWRSAFAVAANKDGSADENRNEKEYADESIELVGVVHP